MMGYLATARGSIDDNIRRGMIYGSVTASFCCEGFGLNRTTKVKRFANRRARERSGEVDEVLEGPNRPEQFPSAARESARGQWRSPRAAS